ncbi:hypothetical protein RA210_U510004 [Rubrivivax sp. A210]|nr:hypothetical protein RA210_U510004 [Rubrivivax sp. A210]
MAKRDPFRKEGTHKHCRTPVTPNPSLKLSTNGGPPGPGRWYAVHFHRSGPGVPPLAPA